MVTIDMRGKPCPIPVIEAKKALASPGSDGVTVLVDNAIAVQNLQKMARGMGCAFSEEQRAESDFAVTVIRDGEAKAETGAKMPLPEALPHTGAGITVLITCDSMGRGSEELGKILIKGFIFSLTQLETRPKAVIFLNSGVKLAVEGSNAVDDLKALAKSGSLILACGTCLNYYGLLDKLAVGEVANMMEIAEEITDGPKTVIL